MPDDSGRPVAGPAELGRLLGRAVAVARRRRRVRLALTLVGVALIGVLVVQVVLLLAGF